MDASEVTRLLEATRDDLVRDVVATLNELGVTRRLLVPAEIDRLRRVIVPHLFSIASLATRYEQERQTGDDEPTRAAPRPQHEGWVGEDTPAARPSARPRLRRRRTDLTE